MLPYIHAKAHTDLIAAANQASLVVNSGYRTVAQQYLLYRWDQLGRCGIAVAATPGNSNHLAAAREVGSISRTGRRASA